MNIPFLVNWRKNRGPAAGVAVFSDDDADAAGVAGLLSECELLRSHAGQAGVELDDSAASLEALDQLVPRWRDDEEILPWLGNDAGLYLVPSSCARSRAPPGGSGPTGTPWSGWPPAVRWMWSPTAIPGPPPGRPNSPMSMRR